MNPTTKENKCKSRKTIITLFNKLCKLPEYYECQGEWEIRVHQAEALAWVLNKSEDKINYDRGMGK